MPLNPGVKVELEEEQEGWFPDTKPKLYGIVTQVLLGSETDNPFYVVELESPIKVTKGSYLESRGIEEGLYRFVVIKSRWRGYDIAQSRGTSVHVVLPPPGTIDQGLTRLSQLQSTAWATCRQVVGDA